MSLSRGIAACVAAALLLSGCASASDGSNVAAGAGEIATTAPLAVPPNLQNDAQVAPEVIATTAPEAESAAAPPTVVADSDPESTVPQAQPAVTAEPEPETESETAVPATSVPAAAVPQAQPQATAIPATLVPQAAATAVPSTAVPATAVPQVATTAVPLATATAEPAAGGPVISLGDFEVVNLVTGANQNIAELSPSGRTMLWFWAPH